MLRLDWLYINYNNDKLYYGYVTTAIVFGDMESVYILNSDHRNQLAIHALFRFAPLYQLRKEK